MRMAGAGARRPPAEEHHGLPAATGSRGEAWDGLSLAAAEGTNPADSLISDFQLLNVRG